MDILFLVALFSNIVVHLYFLIKSSVVSIKDSCKRKCIKEGWCCYWRKKGKNKALKKKDDFDSIGPKMV